MAHRVVFSPQASDDLRDLYLYIAERSGDDRAMGYVGRIESRCRGLSDFPERGTRRDDIASGLRIMGFERRVAIAFHVDPGLVTIDVSSMAAAISACRVSDKTESTSPQPVPPRHHRREGRDQREKAGFGEYEAAHIGDLGF